MSDIAAIGPDAVKQPDLFRLGVSLGLANLAHIAIGVTDVAMIGRLGAPELAAATLANAIYLTVSFAGIAFAIGVAPLVSRYLGAGDTAAAANALGATGLALLIGMVPGTAFIASMEALLTLAGQDAELARYAGSYADWLAVALPFTFVYGLLWCVASSNGRGRAVLILSVAAVGVNFIGNYLFMYGAFGIAGFGLPGAGMSTALTGLLNALALGLWLWRGRVFDRLWQAWRGNAAVMTQMRAVLRYAVPFALLDGATMAFFAVVAFLVGYLGPVSLAAHSIVLQLSEIGIGFTLGFSEAAAVTVAYQDGQGNLAARRIAVRNAVAVGAGCMIAYALIMSAARVQLVPLFIGPEVPLAAETIALAVPLVLSAALCLGVDSGRIVLTGVLQGLDDPKAPAVISTLCFCVIGIPGAALLAFPAGLGVTGAWLGMCAGMGTSSLILAFRAHRRMQQRP